MVNSTIPEEESAELFICCKPSGKVIAVSEVQPLKEKSASTFSDWGKDTHESDVQPRKHPLGISSMPSGITNFSTCVA